VQPDVPKQACQSHIGTALIPTLVAGRRGSGYDRERAYRSQARNVEALEALVAYLQARQPWSPDYRQRRVDQRYVGSGHVEKANDLMVARRQKRDGMQWSQETSDALAALRTLMLNDGWDRYWQHLPLLPLVAG
jgi:hypothetical protein